MATPTYIGDLSFREVSRRENKGKELDSLTINYEGRDSLCDAFLIQNAKGSIANGAPNMFLQTVSADRTGKFSKVSLNYEGFLSADIDNPISEEDDISEMSVSLTTSTDEQVQVRYFGQTLTYKWIYKGAQKPSQPRYQRFLNQAFDVGAQVSNVHPPSFTGSLESQSQMRLTAFPRIKLAPNVWAVTETWAARIVPTSI